jgi:uncharacterized protein (DUF427 family)
MADKPMKIPGPDHPISIDANPSRVVVTVGGKVIADTRGALTLREASYPAVQYIPRRDVDMAALTRSEHTTYCPYKGDASYYSIPAGGDRSRNAVWTYETPFEAMAQIKDYVAFYPDRVDEISGSRVSGPAIRLGWRCVAKAVATACRFLTNERSIPNRWQKAQEGILHIPMER